MTDVQIECLADDVISAFNLSIPIDLERIAREEEIQLIEGDYGEDFHGRIEYLSEIAAFAIYHPRYSNGQYPARVRFSISHEFGHYYIPYHREHLIGGKSHNSLEEFRHKSTVERQADTFAAALLVPTRLLKATMGQRRFLSLSQILRLADDCKASVQATAFRYTRFTTEPHLTLISENGKVLYYFVSEEARARGFGGLRDFTIPDQSPSKSATNNSGLVEGKTDANTWFPERGTSAELWEEAVQLGKSNRVLTLLSWVNHGK